MRFETVRGEGIQHGGRLLVPVARSLRVRLPGLSGGLVWNRPIGVEVERAGERRLLPIQDPTRRLQWLLLGAGLAAALLYRSARRGPFRRRHNRFFRR
jgi:hypothetical protein